MKGHIFHLFCKRLLSACLPFPEIHNPAATTARTQRPGARASVSARVRGGLGCPGRSPPSRGRSPQPQRRPARARGLHCPTHEHTHTHGNAGFPRPRRCPGAGSRRELVSERKAGAPGGAGAREPRSCIRSSAPEAPPLSRPPLLPRAGSARPKSRACARVRRPGPSGAAP